MTDAVTAKLAEWEALANAATEGPWTFEPAGESECGEPQCCYECWDNRIWGGGTVLTESHMLSDADAEFIAAARTATPALLGFVRDMVCAVHVSSSESRGVGRVDPETGEWGAYCDGDGEWWPCPTVQALTKWIGGA